MPRKTSLAAVSPLTKDGYDSSDEILAAAMGDLQKPVKRVKTVAPKSRKEEENDDDNQNQIDEQKPKSAKFGDDEEGEEPESETTSGSDSEDSGGSDDDNYDGESDEDGQKRTEYTAFGRAFHKIMKKKLPSTTFTETMGPILSAHKQLIAKKLEEAATMQKAKSESKREKQAIREKGHVTVTLCPSAKDRELIKLATKGVVKLFNAVSKAQSVQEAAKSSKESETKDVLKRSKSAFLATLQGGNVAVSEKTNSQQKGGNENLTGWSALQDSFMLGKSNLKDWDKQQDVEADVGSHKSSESDDSE